MTAIPVLQWTYPGNRGRNDQGEGPGDGDQPERLARIVRQCHELPGKELFQYYEEDGTRKSIDSGMVNHYIKEAVSQEFTAKDFRTWAGSLHALQAFRAIGEAISAAECKKNLAAVPDQVSQELGNSRAVCRKYYIHPGLMSELLRSPRLLNLVCKIE